MSSSSSGARLSTRGGGRQAKIKNQVYNGVGRRHAPSSAHAKRVKRQAARRRKREMSTAAAAAAAAGGDTSQQLPRQTSARPRVAVIGGGAAGLVSLRYLLAHGCDAVLFEREASVGGVWRHRAKKSLAPRGAAAPAQPLLSNANCAAIGGRSGVSPMYRDLVCNLPKEIMSFLDLPFPAALPSFVHHRDVCAYLSEYVRYHDLASQERLRVNTTVRSAVPRFAKREEEDTETKIVTETETEPTTSPTFLGWQLDTVAHADDRDVASPSSVGEVTRHHFDHLVVANGHYGVPDPRPATQGVPGMDNFPGIVMHSCEYDEREAFSGAKVLVVGAKASGTDLAREISHTAAVVYVCDRNYPGRQAWCDQQEGEDAAESANSPDNRFHVAHADRIQVPPDPHFHATATRPKQAPIYWCPSLDAYAYEDDAGGVGRFRLNDGSVINGDEVDIVIFATGYEYSFPFLPTVDLGAANKVGAGASAAVTLSAGRHCVDGLSAHMFYPSETVPNAGVPNLTFIGLPYSVVPFHLFELQAWWASRRISGIGVTRGDNAASSRDLLATKYSSGSGDPHAHLLGHLQWEYCAAILDQVCDASEADEVEGDGEAKSEDCNVAGPADLRVGKFIILLSSPAEDTGGENKKKMKVQDEETASPPRLARIAGNKCDDGYVNVVMYHTLASPLPSSSSSSSSRAHAHAKHNLKSFVYVPQYPSPTSASSSSIGQAPLIPCKGGRRDRFTETELSSIVSIPETHIAREIAPFDLSRHGNIDPSRLPSIRATNLRRLPKRSQIRPFPTRAHIKARLKLAEDLHAVVSKHRPAMPGAPDTYRSLQFSEQFCESNKAADSNSQHASFQGSSTSNSRGGGAGAGMFALEKRVSILFQKIAALRRETPRSPSLREWEQCLRGIKKSAKKLAEFVSDMDPPLVRKAHKDLFDLIQIALQSGPMAGSKPGKNFPNGNVASVATEFLNSVVQSMEDGPLQFSDIQQGRLSKWHARAKSKCEDSSFVVTAPCAAAGSSPPAPASDQTKTSTTVKTKVNKKKLSAKEKGRLRRERKQAAMGGRGGKGGNKGLKNKNKS